LYFRSLQIIVFLWVSLGHTAETGKGFLQAWTGEYQDHSTLNKSMPYDHAKQSDGVALQPQKSGDVAGPGRESPVHGVSLLLLILTNDTYVS
jgi:hypothetical protein